MKQLLLSLLFLFIGQVNAQSDYSKFDLNLQLGTNLYQKKFGPEWNLQGELHLNAHWSLLYNYSLGSFTPYSGYAHAPMSLFAVGPVTRFLAQNSFTFSDFFGALAVGALTALIPEGVAYHYPIAYRYDLSGFANPLGLAYIISNNPNDDGSIKYDATAGVKLTYYASFGLHANVHVQTRYTAGFGFYPNAGFGLGYSFGHRSLGE
jgi:hypothetical protein